MKIIGQSTLKIEQDEKLIFRMVQVLTEVSLDNGETGKIFSGFPIPLMFVFRKKGEPDHTVNLRPLLDDVASQLGWKQTKEDSP